MFVKISEDCLEGKTEEEAGRPYPLGKSEGTKRLRERETEEVTSEVRSEPCYPEGVKDK